MDQQVFGQINLIIYFLYHIFLQFSLYIHFFMEIDHRWILCCINAICLVFLRFFFYPHLMYFFLFLICNNFHHAIFCFCFTLSCNKNLYCQCWRPFWFNSIFSWHYNSAVVIFLSFMNNIAATFLSDPKVNL